MSLGLSLTGKPLGFVGVVQGGWRKPFRVCGGGGEDLTLLSHKKTILRTLLSRKTEQMEVSHCARSEKQQGERREFTVLRWEFTVLRWEFTVTRWEFTVLPM
eukprot:1075038-Prorocentrum_minimum.AAC.4